MPAGISLKSHKMLWGRAAGRCSISSCRITLVEEGAGVLGEVAHIVAESPDGPRGSDPLVADLRNEYGNLILLCPNHHTEIDKLQPDLYTVARLHQIKYEHERWVQESLAPSGFDRRKELDDEFYAELIDHWVAKADLDNWTDWSSWVFGADLPRMSIEKDAQLYELRDWLIRRVWRRRYAALESSLENFRRVLVDFQETFREHAKLHDDTLITEKFYHIDRWDEELYQQLFKQYIEHVGLVDDLMLELTRAANHVCDVVRRILSPRFRLEEGKLAIEVGPYISERRGGMVYRTFVVEYRATEKSVEIPYPGREAFRNERFRRDLSLGKSEES
jgi:HNH endonuclease